VDLSARRISIFGNGCALSGFQQVTLKVLRWEERDKRLNIKDVEFVA